MDIKNQILTLLRLYSIGEYEVHTFCEIFMELYYGEKSGHRYFQGNEEKALDDLAHIVERYTPYEEDLHDYPNIYVSGKDVKEKFDEIKGCFNI